MLTAFDRLAFEQVLRLQPMSLAVGASGGVGLLAALVVVIVRRVCPPPRGGSTHPRHVRQIDELELVEKAPSPSATAAADADEGVSLCCAGGGVRGEGGESTTTVRAAAGGAPADGASMEQLPEEKPFVPLLVLSALTVSFAHGANDLGNSIGPLAAILVIEKPNGDITGEASIPLWLLTLGSCGFVVGIFLLGSRTIATVGGKITKLTPSRSFAVQLGTAVAVLSSTVLGLAVSTSHCLVGAIIGIGLCDKLRGSSDGELNGSIILKIIAGWAATIPLAMIITVLAYMALLPSYAHDPLCG